MIFVTFLPLIMSLTAPATSTSTGLELDPNSAINAWWRILTVPPGIPIISTWMSSPGYLITLLSPCPLFSRLEVTNT